MADTKSVATVVIVGVGGALTVRVVVVGIVVSAIAIDEEFSSRVCYFWDDAAE